MAKSAAKSAKASEKAEGAPANKNKPDEDAAVAIKENNMQVNEKVAAK